MAKVWCLIVVLLVSILVQTIDAEPNWLGQWIVDTSCDKSRCCCFFDGLAINLSKNETQFVVIGQLDGIELCAGHPVVYDVLDIPTGFSIEVVTAFSPMNFTLSDDSQMISIINPTNLQCNSTATRQKTSAAKLNEVNIHLLFSIFGLFLLTQ